MGTTAEKLEYLNETKSAIASAIEGQGVTVAEDTTFRAYADLIGEIVTDVTVITAVPTVSGTMTYTGSAQTPTWVGYDSSLLTLSGATIGTNAGTYTAVFTPCAGCKWFDDTDDAKSVTWSIAKATIASSPSTSSSLSYTGSAQSPVWENYDSSKMVIGGTYSATNAGSYTATFTPNGNYTWSDSTATAKSVSWSIFKISLTVPSTTSSFTYTGSACTPTWSNYSSVTMTQGGTTSATTAGTYSTTYDLIDSTNYQWADGTTATKSIAWSIAKASGSLSISATTLALDASTTAGAITVTRVGDGVISAVSSDTTVATVSVSGTTVTVTGVDSGTSTVTISVAAGTNYTAPADKTVAVTATFTTIYGVQWAGTSATSMSRTDAAANFVDPVPAVSNGNGSSPFDGLMPWAGMVESTDSAAGTLVAIPKFWYKWTKSGNKMTLQIADGEADGFYVSPAHADRGDGSGERDMVYVGKYHCASTYKSTTGVAQKVDIKRSTARTKIHNLGSTIWQWDFAMHWTIAMLYLVEFANWNSQAKIGYGCSASGSKANNGQTDGMTYHTGTTASARTTYGFTQYRNIEGLWDNVYDWMDGCYYGSSGLYVIIKPASFSDSSGGTLVGKPSGGYPSAMAIPTKSGLEWALYPSTASGSDGTYVPDYWDFYGSSPCLYVGGDYGQNQDRGLFYVYYDTVSGSYSDIGSRLQKLP